MWKARAQIIPSGMRFKIGHGHSVLTFRQLFSLLKNNADFARWYSDSLAESDFAAYFWELPPLTTDNVDSDAEFVLIESAALAMLRPERVPFDSQFALHKGEDVIAFPNLGGDALLIVPTPLGPIEAYSHLATFLRNAPGNQVRSLWQSAADIVLDNLSHTPRWLSTAGLGVAWLHLRLDTRPKYYRFAPYKTAA